MEEKFIKHTNIFYQPKEYLTNVEGKTIRALEENEYNNLVVFLDIDETIGVSLINLPRNVDNNLEIFSTFTKLSDNIKEIKKINDGFYKFEYYVSTPLKENSDQQYWVLIEVMFSFKSFLKELSTFFKEKGIKDIFLFSAANPYYIECIRRVLITDYDFDIKDVFYADKNSKTMYLNDNNKIIEVRYNAKDLWKALEFYNYDNSKIPILFDDREYWAANGFVVKIDKYKNDISDFLDNPILKSPGLLDTSFTTNLN